MKTLTADVTFDGKSQGEQEIIDALAVLSTKLDAVIMAIQDHDIELTITDT